MPSKCMFITIMGWQGLCFMPLEVICQRERELVGPALTIKCPGLEVTHIISIYNSLASTKFMASPHLKRVRKCNPTLPLEHRQLGENDKSPWLLCACHNALLKSVSLCPPFGCPFLLYIFIHAYMPVCNHPPVHLPNV